MYTHHWAYQPSHPAYRTAWPTILHDTHRIIDQIRGSGIVLAGPDGLRAPVLDPDEGIAFNGDATRSLHRDALQLFAPLPATRGHPHRHRAGARQVIADLFDIEPRRRAPLPHRPLHRRVPCQDLGSDPHAGSAQTLMRVRT